MLAQSINSLNSSRVGDSWEWLDRYRVGLDQAYAVLSGGEVRQGMQLLFSALNHARATLVPEDWKQFCRHVCLSHPIRSLVHQEPFTRRGFEKPRGYAGDAVTLDFVYRDWERDSFCASRLGVELHRFLCSQSTIVAVRGRRDFLTQSIDRIVERAPGADLLSVACGHLREANHSQALRESRFGKFLALDQDSRSLAVVERELGPWGIKTIPGSVRAILKGQMRFAGLGLIYAAGLYDYLPQAVAISLTRILFSMLGSGGVLLLANYADPSAASDFKAYMEAFMDWWLIYREEPEVEEWLRELPQGQVLGHRLFRDSTDNLIYLEVIHR
jgi:extracellular factor (EF) 3-hydroxypalmitic acid methyl ester biosynthesis protein